MADKKMTKREMFTNILVLLNAAEADESLIAGIEHEIELLDKRSASKSPNAKKVAEQNANLAKVREVLAAADEGLRATEIANATDFTVQRVTALVRKMVESGEVTRTEDKKVATFTLNSN